MRKRRFLKIAGLVVLGLSAVILYADFQSMHQIYRITGVMINSAPDAQARQHLIAEKDKRDREERRQKIAVGALLMIDVGLFLWVATSLLQRADNGRACST